MAPVFRKYTKDSGFEKKMGDLLVVVGEEIGGGYSSPPDSGFEKRMGDLLVVVGEEIGGGYSSPPDTGFR